MVEWKYHNGGNGTLIWSLWRVGSIIFLGRYHICVCHGCIFSLVEHDMFSCFHVFCVYDGYHLSKDGYGLTNARLDPFLHDSNVMCEHGDGPGCKCQDMDDILEILMHNGGVSTFCVILPCVFIPIISIIPIFNHFVSPLTTILVVLMLVCSNVQPV